MRTIISQVELKKVLAFTKDDFYFNEVNIIGVNPLTKNKYYKLTEILKYLRERNMLSINQIRYLLKDTKNTKIQKVYNYFQNNKKFINQNNSRLLDIDEITKFHENTGRELKNNLNNLIVKLETLDKR